MKSLSSFPYLTSSASSSMDITKNPDQKHHDEISSVIDMLKVSREVIDKYFTQHTTSQLVQHQLESFNMFYSDGIPEIIKQYNPISILHGYNPDINQYEMEVKITFQNVHFTRPVIHENNGSTQLMWPSEARLRNFTYSSPLYVDESMT